jgi:hypothetical protein
MATLEVGACYVVLCTCSHQIHTSIHGGIVDVLEAQTTIQPSICHRLKYIKLPPHNINNDGRIDTGCRAAQATAS